MERELARLASLAHGIVTRQELLRAGITLEEIKQRVARGNLIREYRGIYRVGHRAPGVEARYMAAVKACGERAVLSGRAAAYLQGLIRGPLPPPEVTAPTERRVQGIRTRRSRHLDPKDTTTHRGIPITTVPRTLIDLSSLLSVDALARAFHEAGIRHKTTPEQVERVLARHPNAPGATALRRVVWGDVHVTLSCLESRFLAILRHRLRQLPETNRPAGGRHVDCRWPDLKLTVELDSYTYHRSRHAWEQDRRREREARASGDDFRRYTWGDVVEHPAQMLAELLPLLPTAPRGRA